MYNHFLQTHLSQIQRQYGTSGNVLVYKGFPVSFVQEINATIPSASVPNLITNDGRLDLEVIQNDPLYYVMALRDKRASNVTLFYEEFLILSKNVNPTLLGNKFIIIDNNLFEFYPNPSNRPFIDLDQAIDSERPFDDDEVFVAFYSDSTVNNDVKYVQYPDVETSEWPNVSLIDFFPTNTQLPNKTWVSQDDNTTVFIPLQETNADYIGFKYAVYSNSAIPYTVNILVDNAAQKDLQLMDELNILYHLLTLAGKVCHIYHRRDFYSYEDRPELLQILKDHWQSDQFRTLNVYNDPDIDTTLFEVSQGSVCEHVVQQSESAFAKQPHKDVFLTAPTGAGKSVLFQIPAIYLAQKHGLVTIVVSPLKALMQDQVTALKEDRNYSSVAYINSDISLIEREQVINSLKDGTISILYLSPELLLSYDIKYFIGDRKLGLLVIDEAHLVTTWGRDFRVDYWFLGNYIRKVRKYADFKFPVFALTATAVYNGPNDMVFDTINSLNMQDTSKYIGYVRRNDVSFSIRRFQLPTNQHEIDKVAQTIKVIQGYIASNTKAIVYFPWVNTIGEVVRLLRPEDRAHIGVYHSRVGMDERHATLSNFKSNRIKVVLATKAFGMGVDISDIQEVYHHAPSGTIADYVQEIGRVARRADIEGTASIDYNPKDQKYTKILFGLSSLKQFQVKLVLEKINNVYRLNKKRNFLVSIDDFAHIFPHEVEPEQKVKSALLVLEKDLQAKFRYNVLIVRPKSLFSTVFARVGNTEKAAFLGTYSKYATEEVVPAAATTVQTINRNTTIINEPDTQGTFYKVQLDKVWEDHFDKESFPVIKHKFFTKQLFAGYNQISPQLKLCVTFNSSTNGPLQELTGLFSILETILTVFTGQYFKKSDLYTALNARLRNEPLARNLSNLLIALYTDINHFGQQGGHNTNNTGGFIQKRHNTAAGEDEYRIINAAFQQVKHNSRQRFVSLFGTSPDMNAAHIKFIPADSEKNKESIKLAYIMEVFGLCTYEIVGGELPQIFIRINDPQKISRLATSRNYSNDVVSSVERRQETNLKLMNHFFITDLSTDDRWQFIENYFLGRDLVEEIGL